MATRTTTYLGAPEPFDPASNDWSLYLQRFEHFLLANEIKDEQKLHLLLALVGAQTFRLLTNLVSPLKPGELTYAEVKEKLSAHFKPKPIKIAERFRFYKRQQEQGENMADYMAELRRLASTCEFGTFLDEALLDKFVCGLPEDSKTHEPKKVQWADAEYGPFTSTPRNVCPNLALMHTCCLFSHPTFRSIFLFRKFM